MTTTEQDAEKWRMINTIKDLRKENAELKNNSGSGDDEVKAESLHAYAVLSRVLPKLVSLRKTYTAEYIPTVDVDKVILEVEQLISHIADRHVL